MKRLPRRRWPSLTQPSTLLLSTTVTAGMRYCAAVRPASSPHREGADGIVRLARAIEQIGYDHIGMFDHVAMGFDSLAALHTKLRAEVS